MKIEYVKYVNATIEEPMEFEEANGNRWDTPYIQNALLYDNEEEVKAEIDCYDCPETRKPVKVTITYEL